MDLSFILNHLGEDRKLFLNAVSTPIYRTSNFAFPDTTSFREAFKDEYSVNLYSKGNNPTVRVLTEKIAALEHTEKALMFSSGTSAVSSAILANVEQGDHVICIKKPYTWTNVLLTEYLPRFGVHTTFVDGTNNDEIQAAIQENTRVLFLESPNSISFELQDLSFCAKIAKENDIITIIDNSYASPINQQPADFGIDIIVHSATKYINGHSDLVVGALCCSDKMARHIFEREFLVRGPAISADDAALVLRGLRTIDIRVKKSGETAKEVVKFLQAHNKIERVIHPSLPDFPQAALAKKQMSGFGGLFSMIVKADSPEEVNRFVDRLKYFLLAVSWGGYESLCIPISIFHQLTPDAPPPLPYNLVRLYIGLEEPEVLINDLNQALAVL